VGHSHEPRDVAPVKPRVRPARALCLESCIPHSTWNVPRGVPPPPESQHDRRVRNDKNKFEPDTYAGDGRLTPSSRDQHRGVNRDALRGAEGEGGGGVGGGSAATGSLWTCSHVPSQYLLHHTPALWIPCGHVRFFFFHRLSTNKTPSTTHSRCLREESAPRGRDFPTIMGAKSPATRPREELASPHLGATRPLNAKSVRLRKRGVHVFGSSLRRSAG